eukprot:1159570-Pelagomonas_calceolata.AAC.2
MDLEELTLGGSLPVSVKCGKRRVHEIFMDTGCVDSGQRLAGQSMSWRSYECRVCSHAMDGWFCGHAMQVIQYPMGTEYVASSCRVSHGCAVNHEDAVD